MGDINVGKQEAEVIYNTVINNPAEIRQIAESLRAIKEEIVSLDLPHDIDRNRITKPIDELFANPEAQKDGKMVKEKIEKVNEYLGLFGKTLTGIKTITPYIKTIAKVLGLSSWLGI